MRVLVADDDEVTRNTLPGLLHQLGHEPVMAHDGTEALHVLQAKDAPSLAILDAWRRHWLGWRCTERYLVRSRLITAPNLLLGRLINGHGRTRFSSTSRDEASRRIMAFANRSTVGCEMNALT